MLCKNNQLFWKIVSRNNIPSFVTGELFTPALQKLVNQLSLSETIRSSLVTLPQNFMLPGYKLAFGG